MRQRNHRGMVALMILGGILLSGCASKKSVRDGMSAQDARMSDIESQVEKNQRRLRSADERLDSVSGEVRDAERLARGADEKADEAYGLAQGKLLFKVVLSDTAGLFGLNSAELAEETRSSLTQLARRLKKENASVFIEIEGHTDASGAESYNMTLGLRRAEQVRRYLNSEHEIPLHRMSVISFGESKPVADNDSREGRAKNRRVEVKVLS